MVVGAAGKFHSMHRDSFSVRGVTQPISLITFQAGNWPERPLVMILRDYVSQSYRKRKQQCSFGFDGSHS